MESEPKTSPIPTIDLWKIWGICQNKPVLSALDLLRSALPEKWRYERTYSQYAMGYSRSLLMLRRHWTQLKNLSASLRKGELSSPGRVMGRTLDRPMHRRKHFPQVVQPILLYV